MTDLPISLEDRVKRGYVEGRYDLAEFEYAIGQVLTGNPIDGDAHPQVAEWLMLHMRAPMYPDTGKRVWQ